jgi:PIN domain nuclease of toxin-antitoxin system
MGGHAALSPLLFDTHAWVWWITRPERLGRRQRTAIERTLKGGTEPILVSIISCWEVALLCQRNRFRFSIPTELWLDRATSVNGLEILPLTLAIVVTAARLVSLRDPADMLIVATAQHHGAQLVTSDERVEESQLVATIG